MYNPIDQYGHALVDCGLGDGGLDCTPFCPMCEGTQIYCPTCEQEKTNYEN